MSNKCRLCEAENCPITVAGCCAGCNNIYSNDERDRLLKLKGPFETGAFDAETNNFILTTVNDRRCYTMLKRGCDAAEIAKACPHKMRDAQIDVSKVDFDCADAYYNEVSRKQ